MHSHQAHGYKDQIAPEPTSTKIGLPQVWLHVASIHPLLPSLRAYGLQPARTCYLGLQQKVGPPQPYRHNMSPYKKQEIM